MGKDNITVETKAQICVKVLPPPKFKIPKGLGTLVAKDKEQRKALDTFIVIKAYIKDNRFENTPLQLQQIAAWNRRHVKTIRARLNWLVANKFATLKNNHYHLIDWDELCASFGILKQFHYFKSNSKFFTKQKGYVEYILMDKAVMSVIENQQFIFGLKTDFQEYKDTCEKMLGTCKSEAILKHQLHTYGKAEKFKSNEDWLLNHYRADFQISGNTLKKIFGLTGLGAAIYIKRIMVAKGLWTVTPRKYECGNDIPRSMRKTFLGCWYWDKNQIFLVMPDKIEENNINS